MLWKDEVIISISVVQKFALIMNLEIEFFIPTSGDRELGREERTAFVLPWLMNILIRCEEFLLDFGGCVLHYMKGTPLYLLLLPIQQLREQKKLFEEVEEWGHWLNFLIKVKLSLILIKRVFKPKNSQRPCTMSLHLGGVKVLMLCYCCSCIWIPAWMIIIIERDLHK